MCDENLLGRSCRRILHWIVDYKGLVHKKMKRRFQQSNTKARLSKMLTMRKKK